MTHASTEQPEALLLADQLRDMSSQYKSPSYEKGVINGVIQELRRPRERVQELELIESQLCEQADVAANAYRELQSEVALQSIGPVFDPGHAGMSLRDWFAGLAMQGDFGGTDIWV